MIISFMVGSMLISIKEECDVSLFTDFVMLKQTDKIKNVLIQFEYLLHNKLEILSQITRILHSEAKATICV